jgi:MoxR-like ATPase
MDAMTNQASLPDSVDSTLALLGRGNYVADRALATAVHLALAMHRPLFLEGEAGVGKTEIAKVLAATLGRRLVRLQCYDGLDLASALYDWNYPRQLLEIRLFEASGARDKEALVRGIFDRRFLIERPLLQAISPEGGPAVLLIDELDRADEPFEAFLLELLADFQVTIPELGTIRAETPPVVILTSNRTREIHDALRRRCLYHWVDFPDAEREREILRLKAPQAPERLSRQVVAFVQRLRQMDLFKMPGVAETIDWCGALAHLNATELDPARVNETLGVLLKYQDDIARIRGEQAASLVAEARGAA